MSRSAYIYIIQKFGIPAMAFTVKKEMVEYLDGSYSEEGLNAIRVFRVRDCDQSVCELNPFTLEVV